MEPVTLKALASLYVYGPLGVLSVLGFLLFFMERKRSIKLNDRIIEMSADMIKSEMGHGEAIRNLERTVLANRRGLR